MSDEVRDAVLQAMKTLNYQPNAVAKSLRSRSTKTIGLMVSDITNPFFTNVVRGVEDEANKNGYNIILCNTDENSKKEKTYLNVLIQKQVDGIIIAPTSKNGKFIADLMSSNFKFVFIDRYFEDVNASRVIVDNELGAYEATSHLLGLGHHRVGLIAGLSTISTTKERIQGYIRALTDFGIGIDSDLIREGNSKIDGGYEECLALLGLSNPPSSIFSANNLMTVGAMRALEDQGVHCPKDIALVGFDDLDWATTFHPYLTTVVQPIYEVGKTAASILISELKNKNRPTSHVTLPCKLVIRESSGAILTQRPVEGHKGNE